MGFSLKPPPKAPEITPPPTPKSVEEHLDPQNVIGNSAIAEQLPKPTELSTTAVLDMAPKFPDNAKVPSPAGTTPIPYPNVSLTFAPQIATEAAKLRFDVARGPTPGAPDRWGVSIDRMRATLDAWEASAKRNGRVSVEENSRIAAMRANLDRLHAELERMKEKDAKQDEAGSAGEAKEIDIEQAYETLSSLTKALHDTAMQIIRNIRA